MNLYLGFDGGGTKTECIALDADGRIVGHGNSGPSNPLRVGYNAACAALQLAAGGALALAQYVASAVRGNCAGAFPAFGQVLPLKLLLTRKPHSKRPSAAPPASF